MFCKINQFYNNTRDTFDKLYSSFDNSCVKISTELKNIKPLTFRDYKARWTLSQGRALCDTNFSQKQPWHWNLTFDSWLWKPLMPSAQKIQCSSNVITTFWDSGSVSVSIECKTYVKEIISPCLMQPMHFIN